MAEVKGAGDTSMRENPKVTSKFDRMHGHPRVPGQVAKPGGTAEPGSARSHGAAVSYNEHSGHMQPIEVTPPHTPHTVHSHHPSTLGSNMADGEHGKHAKNFGHTDRYPERER